MKFDFMKTASDKVTRAVCTAGMKLQKHSPEILVGLGIIGFGGTVILACRATLHAEEILDRHAERMELAEKAEQVAEPEDNYDIQKEKTAIYIHTVVDFVKLYTPSVALGGLSVAMILVASNILKKRYLGAVAAFNAVSEVFETYRNRVKDEFGEEADRYFRYGIKKELREVASTDENGTEVVESEEVEVADQPVMPSDYAKIFDCTNPNWDENPAFNLSFLKAQQAMANDILHTRGHLFLNEVYEMLGFDHTPIGAVAGWVLGDGDDYVDFGLYDYSREDVRRFINGKESNILLDFNISGSIWDRI